MSMNMELDGNKSEPNQVPSVPLNPVPAGSLPQAMQNASNPQLETVIILTIWFLKTLFEFKMYIVCENFEFK